MTRGARVGRAAGRGLVAAMAMTGIRTATANLGLLRTSPPEAIVEQRGPRLLHRLDDRRRAGVTELVHWTYGAAGGAAFGMLPVAVRAHRLTGPLYGLVVWLGFEAGIAPVLELRHNTDRRVLGRAMVALDHVLYGLVVAGRLAPDPQVVARERGRARALR